MKMNLTGAIEILKLHKHTTDKFKHSVGDQYVSDAIDTVIAELEKPTTPKEIEDARKFIRECHADIGFMGSPEYYEKRKMLKEWDKRKGGNGMPITNL